MVMANWAAIKDWAIGRFLEPPPMPPIPAAYNYGAVLNETLRQGEKDLAAVMMEPSRFGLPPGGWYKQGVLLQDALDAVDRAYRRLWPIDEMKNQTIIDNYKRLESVESDARGHLRDGLNDIEYELYKAIIRASEQVDITANHLSYVLNIPSDKVVQIWGDPSRRFSRIEYWYRRRYNLTVDYDGDPELLRNDTLWDTVCYFQAYIIRRNSGLLNYSLRAREMLKASINKFEPAKEFMRKELVIRKDMARVIIDDIHQRYNTSMQEWGASLPNRWYNSSGVLMGILGWYLDGRRPPRWPDYDLAPHRRNMDNLERAQARIIFAQGMMRSIEAHLADSRIRIDYAAARPADVDANHPCPLRLGNADNSTQPQSPHEMLHILEEHVAAFDRQIHSWDEELFHNHVQQAWERMKGDLYTTAT